MHLLSAGSGRLPGEGHVAMSRLNLTFLIVAVIATCVAFTLLSFLEAALSALGTKLIKIAAGRTSPPGATPMRRGTV